MNTGVVNIVFVKTTKDAYIIDGREYSRVTKVLDVIPKPELDNWYRRMGKKYCDTKRDVRASFGTRVHKEIQNLLEKKEVWVDDAEMMEDLQMFKEWSEKHNLKPVSLEQHLYNDDLMVAGTCDFIGEVDGELKLLDWKTSKRLYDQYPIQVSAYLYMYEQQFDTKLEGAGIVSFRNGKVKEKHLDRSECYKLLPIFKACNLIYRWKYGKS